MAEVFNAPVLKWGPDIVSKEMTVTATSETVCVPGYPVTIAADGVNATVGNAGGSGKILGILAEGGTFGTSGKTAKVIYAGTVYAEGIKAALPSADIDKLAVTPGKVLVIERKEEVIYG